MQVIINPGGLNGNIIAPASKSMTQRAYAAALLHNGTTEIHDPGNSDDEMAVLKIIQQLGATIESRVGETKNSIIIASKGVNPISNLINCDESGLAARLFTPIVALSGQNITIEGRGSLLARPMGAIERILNELGVTLSNFNGYLPFSVGGKLAAKSINVDAGNSSQFLTGLLFALSSCAIEPITLSVTDLESKPYIDLTLDVLAHFGMPVKNNNYQEFYIDPAVFTRQDNISVSIERDWSSAAFLLVAGAIAGEITMSNLNMNSKQADRAILQILKSAGADISVNADSVIVKKSFLHSFDYDATDSPDLFPVLSILAACCVGESTISGVHRLFHKESNRAESITGMLANFDLPFSIEDDTLCITGIRKLQGTVIESYNDHRIVMAATIGALRAGSRVDIIDAGVVNKSYPGFFEDLRNCGVGLIKEE